ncbi:MAG: hypothetical protein M3261_05455 [Thermoproteota archaeon]|nr:hypothetical protein [Thermoproteota archaeon]
MKTHNERNMNDNKNNNRAAKAISAIPIAAIVVAASLLLSGLSIVGSYHSVLAQQNMTQSGGGAGNATTSGMAGGNATTTGGAAGGNQSEVRMHVEESRTALQNNDIQGAIMHLDLALNVLGGGTQGNMTSAAGSTNSTG